MQQPVRDYIIDLMLDNELEKLEELFREDSYARIVYLEERPKFLIEKELELGLTDGEKAELEVYIFENPSLRAEYELRRKINKFSDDIGLINAIDNARMEFEKQEDPDFATTRKKIVRTKLFSRFKYAAAATVLMLLTISAILRINDNYFTSANRLFDRYYDPISFETSNHFSVTGDMLNNAKEYYFKRDFSNAYNMLKELPDAISIETERDFYLGLTLMEMEDYDAAIAKISKVVMNKSFESLPQAYWYLGLCYLKHGENKKASSIFRNIAESGSYKHKQAAKIYRQMQKLSDHTTEFSPEK